MVRKQSRRPQAVLYCASIYGAVVVAGALLTDDIRLWFTEMSIPSLLMATLIYYSENTVFSRVTYITITSYLLFHGVVCIDPVAQAPIGSLVGGALGWERNNTDRILHFGFGLAFRLPISEMLAGFWQIQGRANLLLACLLVLAGGAIYELLEWKTVVLLGEDLATVFQGHLGDPWDTHHDLMLALLGAILSAIIGRVTGWWGSDHLVMK